MAGALAWTHFAEFGKVFSKKNKNDPRKQFDPLTIPRVGFHEERVNRTTHITTKAKCARADGNASCAVVIASTGNDKPILSR